MERGLSFLVNWVQDYGPRSQNEHNPETNKKGPHLAHSYCTNFLLKKVPHQVLCQEAVALLK